MHNLLVSVWMKIHLQKTIAKCLNKNMALISFSKKKMHQSVIPLDP